MSAPPEIINTEKVVEEPAQKMEREAKIIALEVAEVLAEVPKSLRMLRPKSTPTKEIVKYKKGKQLAIPMRASPRRNPPKPTAHKKDKAINLGPEEEYIEDILMDDEDVGMEVEEVEAYGIICPSTQA